MQGGGGVVYRSHVLFDMDPVPPLLIPWFRARIQSGKKLLPLSEGLGFSVEWGPDEGPSYHVLTRIGPNYYKT